MRIEDTDKERSRREYEDEIKDSMKWLGLNWDNEGSEWRQSERSEIYKAKIQELIKKGAAYVSRESAKDDSGKEVEVVRLKNQGKTVAFTDLVRGDITFDTTELGNMVIARSLNEPLYHLAVVVDDAAMNITHVIRGDDHISNTPRQILIQEALGYTRPMYVHLPLILMPDKSKMSKRKHQTAIGVYKERGFLPEALLNYLALLGWSPEGKEEILSKEELVRQFRIERIHKSGAVFDLEKLRWMNRQYLLEVSESDFMEELLHRTGWHSDVAAKCMPLIKERISVWGDIETLKEELGFLFAAPPLQAEVIPGKYADARTAKQHLAHLKGLFTKISPAQFEHAASLKESVWEYATKEGRGSVLWPLRYTLSGRTQSPDPFTIAAILGKEETLRRIDTALDTLET